MKYDVLSINELGSEELKEVKAGKTPVLLARDGDRVLATAAYCTHKGAPLAQGARTGNRVVCPFHHAIFAANN